MDYARNEYREFYIHKPTTDVEDTSPRIIMRTLDGYVIFDKTRQDELRKLLNEIDKECVCV